MKFKAKLFRLGNSKAVYIPKDVYTNYKDGEFVHLEVYTRSLKRGRMYIQGKTIWNGARSIKEVGKVPVGVHE